MNGKDYVIEVLEDCNRVSLEIESEGALEGEPLLDELKKALADLESLKNKPSLRTKDGTNLVFPVKEAADNLKDQWDDGKGSDPQDLKARIEEFADSVNTFAGALKSRTVIMT
jgi:hypothetical protein